MRFFLFPVPRQELPINAQRTADRRASSFTSMEPVGELAPPVRPRKTSHNGAPANSAFLEQLLHARARVSCDERRRRLATRLTLNALGDGPLLGGDIVNVVSRMAFACSTTQGSGDCAENHRESCRSGADCASLGGFLSDIARLSLARLRVGYSGLVRQPDPRFDWPDSSIAQSAAAKQWAVARSCRYY